MNWYVSLRGINVGISVGRIRKNQAPGLHVGQRILTSKGEGVITGGNIMVKLDRAPASSHPNDKEWTFNLDKPI